MIESMTFDNMKFHNMMSLDMAFDNMTSHNSSVLVFIDFFYDMTYLTPCKERVSPPVHINQQIKMNLSLIS